MILAAVGIGATLAGLMLGYFLSKRAVEWCPTCGMSLAGHCPGEQARSFAAERPLMPNSSFARSSTDASPLKR